MEIVAEALTFDDVLLMPGYSSALPNEVELKSQLTNKIPLHIPLLSAAMDTVTEAQLAIALAQEGGMGFIHKNMTIEQQVSEVRKVKKFESGMIHDPITINIKSTVRDLLNLVEEHKISGLPVVVEGNALVGIVTQRDWRFETNLELPVAEIMTPKERLVTVQEGASYQDIISQLHRHRLEKVLVVNDAFQLRGMVTVKDIQKAKDKPLASKDEQGRLCVGAAVGTSAETKERVAALIAAGVDVILVDSAHGHSAGVIDNICWIRESYPQVQLIGGNIATAEAAIALADAGVNAVKVGIGPGSICTTRIVSGVGVPQITAISEVSTALRDKPVNVIADGGIRYSGDISKALAAGADSVMVGSLLAGTEEAPGDVVFYQGRSYKSYRGMGSLGAMSAAKGARNRYFQDNVKQPEKLVPEGIEGRVPYKGSMLNVVAQLMGGVRSSMGYVGVKTIIELQQNAKLVKITGAGMRESHVHDVTITEEAPNYPTH